MTRRQRFFSIVIGIVGALGSIAALAQFLMKVRRNGLEFPELATRQVLYRLVGTAYGGGFVAGFSLCFFLALLAVAVGTWLETRRGGAATGITTESVRIPLVDPPRQG